MNKLIDKGNLVVIVLTIALFLVASYAKGLTKDLLLEAGVLLVSIKLILFNYKQSLFDTEVLRRLDEIQKNLSDLKK
jgi:hypothetical protein